MYKRQHQRLVDRHHAPKPEAGQKAGTDKKPQCRGHTRDTSEHGKHQHGRGEHHAPPPLIGDPAPAPRADSYAGQCLSLIHIYPAATKEYDEHRLAEVSKSGGGEHRPSMGQDMVKGRRTEIEFLNGLISRKGDEVGIPTPANRALVDIVKRVEKGELKPDPKHLIDLRLN